MTWLTGIRWKFLAWTGVCLAATLAVSAWISLSIFDRALDEVLAGSRAMIESTVAAQVRRDKESTGAKATNVATMLAAMATDAVRRRNIAALHNYAEVAAQDPDINYVTFVDKKGDTLAGAGDTKASGVTVVAREIDVAGSKRGAVSIGYNTARSQTQAAATKQRSAVKLRTMRERKSEALASAGANMTVMFVVVLLVTGGVLLLVTGRIVAPLAVVVRALTDISEGEGDLTRRLATKGHDEITAVATGFNRFAEKTERLVALVKQSAASVAEAAARIVRGSGSLSERTQAQAASVEETASSMEELASTVKETANNTRKAKELADEALSTAKQGGDVVAAGVNAMAEIRSSSEKITEIVSTIESIAFQSSLLALNAAVEAAHAGENGRGFAVVASEVRSLAGRSAQAAAEIKTLIEDSAAKVQTGMTLAGESGQTLEAIVARTDALTEIIGEIAVASAQQASGIDQINTALAQIDTIAQQNTQLVEESAGAGNTLSEQAQHLANLMALFKVGEFEATIAAPAFGRARAESPSTGQAARIDPPADLFRGRRKLAT